MSDHSLNINPDWEVHPTDVQRRLAQHEKLLMLDVRQLREWNVARLAGATLVPLHELADRAPAELAAWQKQPIIVYCHHGVRSLKAAAILRHLGYEQVHSMAGGIEAWSVLVDPAIPRY